MNVAEMVLKAVEILVGFSSSTFQCLLTEHLLILQSTTSDLEKADYVLALIDP